VGLERGPLSLVSTTEEILRRKRSGSGQERREYGRRDLPRRPRDNPIVQTLALTSVTSGGRSVGIVRSLTKATELLLLLLIMSAITGRHKVRLSTYFVLINQLEKIFSLTEEGFMYIT
jgi:hypothetical protein